MNHPPLTEDQRRLVACHMPLAIKMAKARVNPFVSLDDRIQHACLGLIAASRDFDPTRGVKFSTYAFRCIWGAIRDGEREGGFFGGTSKQRLARIKAAGRRIPKVVSIESYNRDASFDGCRDQRASDVLFVAQVERDPLEDRDAIEAALASLQERARFVVRRCYLDGATQQTAAREIGVSESYISQLVARSLDRLRNHSILAPYVEGV